MYKYDVNIITVIPITRQKVFSTLSYFTSSNVPLGAVVAVPLRGKTIHAIVKDTRKADDIKTEIRNAPFEIKKLGAVKVGSFFSTGCIEACRALAEFYAVPMGTIVRGIIPESILENTNKVAPPLPAQASFLQETPTPDETYIVQGDDNDRVSSWRSLIRQQFARKKSIAVYVPTLEDVKYFYNALEKGIEGYIFMLHGGLTQKKFLETWKSISELEHPVVIVTTPFCAVLPRGDIESVVIERENGRGWTSLKAPYMDYRRVIETIARKEKKTVFVADSLVRIETLYRLEDVQTSDGATEGTPFKWRSISTALDTLVSMKRDTSLPSRANEPFRVIGTELEELIRKNMLENTHLFLMTSRRGHSTVTVCDDCENIVTCTNCNTPVVLHASKTSGANFYLCHACGTRMSAEEPCRTCAGHRLSPLGIGTERVKEELKKMFPALETFVVDADTTRTEKQMMGAIDKWRSRPGTVLIGTETALNHLGGTVDHVGVVSIDSLFAIPDFRIEERIMYLLIRLRSSATRSIVVQTRRPEEKVFEYGLKGNLSDFSRTVLAERKRFEYPPFSVLIKITIEGARDTIAKHMGELQAHLSPHEIDVFPAFTATPRGTSLIHGLIKLPTHSWPNTELATKLSQLPASVSVRINPEHLL